jgi:hypothetical protein
MRFWVPGFVVLVISSGVSMASNWSLDSEMAEHAESIRTTLCGDRRWCRIEGPTAAGEAPDGSRLWVVGLDLLEPDPENGVNSQDREYWLIRRTKDGITTARHIHSEHHPDGYGMGGGGSEVQVSPNRFHYNSESGWRWGITRLYRLHPWKLLNATVFSADWVSASAFEWASEGRPDHAEYRVHRKCSIDPDVWFTREFTSEFIPLIWLSPEWRDQWPHAEIGTCALTVSDAPGSSAVVSDDAPDQPPRGVSMRVVAVSRRHLLVQIEDPNVSILTPGWPTGSLRETLDQEDHLELWLGYEPGDLSCPESWSGLPPGLRQWTIGLSNGDVIPGFGAPEVTPAARVLTAPGIEEVVVLEMTLPSQLISWGVTVVYSDLLAPGKRRRIATSPLVFGDPWTLGALSGLPEPWFCRFEDGVLNTAHQEAEPWVDIHFTGPQTPRGDAAHGDGLKRQRR